MRLLYRIRYPRLPRRLCAFVSYCAFPNPLVYPFPFAPHCSLSLFSFTWAHTSPALQYYLFLGNPPHPSLVKLDGGACANFDGAGIPSSSSPALLLMQPTLALCSSAIVGVLNPLTSFDSLPTTPALLLQAAYRAPQAIPLVGAEFWLLIPSDTPHASICIPFAFLLLRAGDGGAGGGGWEGRKGGGR